MNIEDPQILEQLRNQIRAGKSAVDAMRFLIERLNLDPTRRLDVMRCFQKAFDIDFSDSGKLGAWEFFIGSGWSEDAVNKELTPRLIEALQKIGHD